MKVIRKILKDYMDGPCNEPNISDAHDFLMMISDHLEETDREVCHCGEYCDEHTQASGHTAVPMERPPWEAKEEYQTITVAELRAALADRADHERVNVFVEVADEAVVLANVVKVTHHQPFDPEDKELNKEYRSVCLHISAKDLTKQDAERIEELERRVEHWQQLQAKTESALNALKGNS